MRNNKDTYWGGHQQRALEDPDGATACQAESAAEEAIGIVEEP